MGEEEVEWVAGWVVDAQGMCGDDHFGAIDRVYGVQSPGAGHRVGVYYKWDAKGQAGEPGFWAQVFCQPLEKCIQHRRGGRSGF